MPANTIQEWPQDRKIRVLFTECEHGPCVEIITVNLNDSEDLDFGWIRLLKSDENPWMVDQAHAIHGWGPLFYDVAMEIGTKLGHAIRPHFQNVSPDAQAVWLHYFQQRHDVSYFRLPESIEVVHDTESIELHCGYYKSNTIALEMYQNGSLLFPNMVGE